MSLCIHNATLTYPDGRGRLTALDRVNLEVPDGRLIALTGPSGSGKSSLLAVAGTLITPDSGTVRIGNQQVEGLNARQRARLRREEIGFVFQQDNLLPALTAVEQLLLTVSIRGGRPSRQRADAMSLLEEVGMAESADRRPHELSGGMRQRVNIARAMMGTPTLLLIDEPTSSLDSERSREVITLIANLVRRRDLAAVLVSHDLDSLAPGDATGVDATVVIKDGRIESNTAHVLAA